MNPVEYCVIAENTDSNDRFLLTTGKETGKRLIIPCEELLNGGVEIGWDLITLWGPDHPILRQLPKPDPFITLAYFQNTDRVHVFDRYSFQARESYLIPEPPYHQDAIGVQILLTLSRKEEVEVSSKSSVRDILRLRYGHHHERPVFGKRRPRPTMEDLSVLK